MEYVYAFIAGFVATFVFHQGVLSLLHAKGFWPKPAYVMTPTGPLHVPAVVSLAFWGGVWGVALWLVVRGAPDPRYWMLAAAFGAIAPSVVALFLVFPLKGLPMAGGWAPKVIVPVLVLNAAWGLGTALIVRLLRAL